MKFLILDHTIIDVLVWRIQIPRIGVFQSILLSFVQQGNFVIHVKENLEHLYNVFCCSRFPFFFFFFYTRQSFAAHSRCFILSFYKGRYFCTYPLVSFSASGCARFLFKLLLCLGSLNLAKQTIVQVLASFNQIDVNLGVAFNQRWPPCRTTGLEEFQTEFLSVSF